MMRSLLRRTGGVLGSVLLVVGCAPTQKPVALARHDPGIRISPDPATVAAQLSVVLEDPGVDPLRCSYVWERNGIAVALAGSRVLDPDQFRKGEHVAVVVTVPATETAGARVLRAETNVVNTAPIVRSVTLTAAAANGGAQLAAAADVWDADGDAITCEYRWLRNGAPIDGATGATLEALALAKADRIEVEALASDGEARSEKRRSEVFAIENRAPRFTPDGPLSSVEGDELRVRVSATDADADPISFQLVQSPDGMTIDANGAIRWKIPPRERRPDDVRVAVRASDGRGGEATQEFSIRLTAAAATVPR